MSVLQGKKENEIILSICIPTLGGCDRLEEGLRRILRHPGKDIEIIISDNDNTGKISKVLNLFSDERIHYYSNCANCGAIYNWIKVLTYGKGKYLLALNDNDWIVEENLFELIDFLKKEESSVIVGEPIEGGRITYTKGVANAYSCTGEVTHPSYFILKREKIHNIENIMELASKIDVYVQCVLALVCSKDDKVCVNKKIRTIEMPDDNYLISHAARSDTAKNGRIYTPIGALEILDMYIKICEGYYSRTELLRMIPNLYRAQLKRATIDYKNFSANIMMTTRYGLEYRTDINLDEERKNFYRNVITYLEGKYPRTVLVHIWRITVLDKIRTSFSKIYIEETIQDWIRKYRWAQFVQKCWRKMK